MYNILKGSDNTRADLHIHSIHSDGTYTKDQLVELAFELDPTLSKENLELAAMVNSHILVCDKCREKVEAFQVVSDSLMGTLAFDAECEKLKELDK